jgi:stage II sporulation protein D
MKKILTTIILTLVYCLVVGFKDTSPTTIRVAILLDIPSVAISATGDFEISTPGEAMPVVAGDKDSVYAVRPGIFGLKLDDIKEYGYILLVRPGKDSFIRANKQLYRGLLEIRKQDDSLLVINEVDLEEYLYGVMKHEISPAWPPAAIKAQALAARTFALNKKMKNIGKSYDLVATIASQVYGGLAGEDPRSNKAIDETRGEILTYKGEPIAAYYHATCGGETEEVENVWGGRAPYLESVDCKYCKDSPHYEWETKLDLSVISNALSHKGISEIKSIDVYERAPTGRVVKLVIRDEFGKHIMSGNEFRMALGPSVIRSTLFKMKEKRDKVEFKGNGWGHGVGMCQWGARGMAEKGYSYKKILKHYYRNAEVEKGDKE